MGIYPGKIMGTLISRQTNIGSRSEGPQYFICPTDNYKRWREIPIQKKILRWMPDPVLHKFIGEMVILSGEITETKDTISIEYKELHHNGKIIPASTKSGKVVISSQKIDKELKDLFSKDPDAHR